MTLSQTATATPKTITPATVDARIAIKKRVQSALPPTLAVTRLWLPASLKDKQISWVSVTWRAAPRAGLITTRVSVRGPEGAAQGWVRLRIQQLLKVLVTTKPLVAGQRIAAADLALSRRAVPPKQGWSMLPKALIGAKILTNLPAGRVVNSNHVAEPAPLPRGTRVMAIVRRGRVTVSAPALLERSVRVGELTTARLVYGRRAVRGRLVDPKTMFIGDHR